MSEYKHLLAVMHFLSCLFALIRTSVLIFFVILPLGDFV